MLPLAWTSVTPPLSNRRRASSSTGPVVEDVVDRRVALVAHAGERPVGLEPGDARGGRRLLDDGDRLSHGGRHDIPAVAPPPNRRHREHRDHRGHRPHRRLAAAGQDPRPDPRRRLRLPDRRRVASARPASTQPSARIAVTGDDDVLGSAARRAAGARGQPHRRSRRRARGRPTGTACCPPASTRRPTWPPRCGSTAPGSGREPGDGLRASSSRDGHARDRADAPGPGRRPGRRRQRRRAGAGARRRPATRRCSSSWRRRSRRRSPRRCWSPGWPSGSGPPATGAGRCWPSAGPAVVHTGGAPDLARLVAGRLGRRAVRRQRLRHPRHRVQRARHVARRVGGRGHAHRGRPRQPPPGHQRGAAPRLDRGRGRGRLRDRRRDVRVRRAGACRSCSAARSATTGRCPTSSPTSSPPPTPCGPSCPASRWR